MEWNDEGIVLKAKRHSEADLLVVLMTFEHGRHAGLVRAGGSRRNAPYWQTGNRLEVTWKARLADQLGGYQGELIEPLAARVMQEPIKLTAMASVCAMIDACLPERQPFQEVYAALLHVLRSLDKALWPEDYIRFELLLLERLGFGLQLDRCAVTGTSQELSHVSPRTGRAVSSAAAAPYKQKLLELPSFLQGGHAASSKEIAQGLRLAGFFFARHVFMPADRGMPVARDRLVAMLTDIPVSSGDDSPV